MESIIPTEEDLFILIHEVSKPEIAIERHVRFAPVPIFSTLEGPISCCDNVGERWYQKEEIGKFKLYVQNLTTAVIRGEKPKAESTDGTYRGLEHYCDLNRLKRKQEVIAHVLKVQGTVKDNRFGTIVHDCTAWHRDIAFAQGLHDYCDVYNPSMASSMPRLPSPPEFQLGQKETDESSKKGRCANTSTLTPPTPKRLRSSSRTTTE